MDKFYPVLCGGTFLTLLLRARKQRMTARDLLTKGKKDTLSDRHIFLALIKIIKPNYLEPEGFSKITSDYKSCKKQSPEHLSLLRDFSNQLEMRYPDALEDMVSFIEKYLDVDPDGGLHDRLARELLDLIEQDQDINNEDVFHILPAGTPAMKSDLRSSLVAPLDVCLPVFLLSVWHFIIKNRPDTTIGKETYESWHLPQLEGSKSKREYIGTIGESYKRPLNISVEVPFDSGIETEKRFISQSNPAIDDLTENESPYDGELSNLPIAIAKKIIPSGSRVERDVVMNKGLSTEKDDDNEEIKALLNGQPSQATKDGMRRIVDEEILPELREKLQEPLHHIYDLIISQAKGADDNASNELGKFIHFIDSEVLNESTAPHMMRLSEHEIYGSLLKLRELIENHSRNTMLVAFGDNCCEPPYYIRLKKEFESLVMEIFNDDDEA